MGLPGGPWRAAAREADADERARLLQQTTSQYPQSAAAWGHLGLAHLDAGRPPEAVEALTRACSLEPRNPAWPTLLSLAAGDAGDSDGARKALETSLGLAPGNVLAEQIGLLQDLRDGRHLDTLEKLARQQLLAHDRLLGRIMVEVERLNLEADTASSQPAAEPRGLPAPTPQREEFAEVKARLLFGRAQKLMEQALNEVPPMDERLCQQAADLYEQALSKCSTVPRGYYFLAEACMGCHRLEDARLALDRSLVDDGENPNNCFYMGKLWFEQGEVGQARAWLEKAVSRFEKFPEALLVLGQIALHEGDVLRARAYFQKAAHYAMDIASMQIKRALRWVQQRSVT